jgi:hypothetical protein
MSLRSIHSRSPHLPPGGSSRLWGLTTLAALALLLVSAVAFTAGTAYNLAWAAQETDKVGQEEPPPNQADLEEERAERATARLAKLREGALSAIQAASTKVHVPDPHALAKALGIGADKQGGEGEQSAPGRIKDLGDLDGDGIPEIVLRWTGAHEGGAGSGEEEAAPLPLWTLFLFSWDGARWQASHLTDGVEPLSVQAQPLLGPAARELVVVLFVGGTEVPYPVIFEFKNHAASLLWDARADESRYQGYAFGQVEFRDVNGDGRLEMEVSGRADPGLLVFPTRGERGFMARAVYSWDGKAYVPGKTEYSLNQDFTLYRFVAALHLHDFRAAYALIDPAQFLKTQKPSLEAFRQFVESNWPEFLDDQIFEVEQPEEAPNDFAFELTLDDKRYTYHPTFRVGPTYLLTGLERREEEK